MICNVYHIRHRAAGTKGVFNRELEILLESFSFDLITCISFFTCSIFDLITCHSTKRHQTAPNGTLTAPSGTKTALRTSPLAKAPNGAKRHPNCLRGLPTPRKGLPPPRTTRTAGAQLFFAECRRQ